MKVAFDNLLDGMDARYLLMAFVAALVILRLMGQSDDPTMTVLIAAIGGCVLYAVLNRARDSTPKERRNANADAKSNANADANEREGSSATKGAIDGELYTLRVPFPLKARPPVHLGLRSDVSRALKALAPFARHSKGAVGRSTALLEDFYARFDAALLSSDGALARRTIPVLLDTRAEALNTLHTLHYVVPVHVGHKVDLARRAVRRDTQRCIGTLSSKHGASLKGLWMKPPYAWDPTARRDDRYNIHF